MKLRIVGGGRAGSSFAAAFTSVGVPVEVLGRHDDLAGAAQSIDALLICTPDAAIADVAAQVRPGTAVLLHCSGATGLDALEPHTRRGSLHPLMALPDQAIGSQRLLAGGWFATAGDPLAGELVGRLGGRSFEVPDDRRALYHATAAIAANHLVALLGQVERLAQRVGVPIEAFLDLAAGSFDDVRRLGAVTALTGPAARGDQATLTAHRAALPDDERALYDALVDAASTLSAANQRVDTPEES